MRTPFQRPSTACTAVATACSLAALASCGTSDSAPVTTAPVTSPSVPAPGVPETQVLHTPSSELEPLAGTQPLDVLTAPDADLRITDVRTGQHQTFDRFVVELAGTGDPGWLVTASDSTLAVDIRGTGSSDPAAADVTAADRAARDTPGAAITSVADAGPGQRTHSFTLGLASPRPMFTLNVLTNPTRIVVDVRHP